MSQARNLRVPKFAEEAVERARLAVVPRQRRQAAPRVPFAILVGLVLLGGVAGLLLFNTHMQKSSFAATALQERADVLHAKEQQLRSEIDRLRDPQVLGQRAKEAGMLPPDSPAFLDLATGQIIGNPAPSTGVDDFVVHAPDASKPPVLNPTPVRLPRKVIDLPSGAATAGTPADAGTNNQPID
jgi:cell division protein FtsB